MKPGVDGQTPALALDVDGVGVAADVLARLEHGDLVLALQLVGRDQARDARADDGDLHDGVPALPPTALDRHALGHRPQVPDDARAAASTRRT